MTRRVVFAAGRRSPQGLRRLARGVAKSLIGNVQASLYLRRVGVWRLGNAAADDVAQIEIVQPIVEREIVRRRVRGDLLPTRDEVLE